MSLYRELLCGVHSNFSDACEIFVPKMSDAYPNTTMDRKNPRRPSMEIEKYSTSHPTQRLTGLNFRIPSLLFLKKIYRIIILVTANMVSKFSDLAKAPKGKISLVNQNRWYVLETWLRYV